MPFVYFVQAEDERGPIKIGFSTNPRRRVEELQTMHTSQLFLLGVVECTSDATERALHRRFAGSHVRGEWYRPTPDLLFVIEMSQHVDTIRSRAARERVDEALRSKPAAMRALGWGRAGAARREIRRRMDARRSR